MLAAKSNTFLIFDYQGPTDFKFAGVNVSNDKLEMGYRDATGWHVVEQVNSQLKPDTDYDLLLALNGTVATLVVNNQDVFTHVFAPRVDLDGFMYGLNAGMVGIGATNSKARIDNVKVQVRLKEGEKERIQIFEGLVIARKHGAQIRYPHPDLEPILKPTYGVILYQEQVMQIAQVLAGYTLGGADLLRRAMGKKKPAEMAKQRVIFTEGALARGVEEKTATYIFDLMEKFAGYGFNKSHSAAYAVLSYQTAYLKAHYPAAFMAAVMSADLHNTDRLVTLKDDCRQLGLKLLPPNVNHSSYHFSVPEEATILYGLGAIKGVGRGAVESLIADREVNGPFRNLTEFCRRADHDKLNRRAIEAMIKAGAMDSFGETRRGMMHELQDALRSADQQARAAAAGQNDMFGHEAAAAEEPLHVPTQLDEWPDVRQIPARVAGAPRLQHHLPVLVVQGHAEVPQHVEPEQPDHPVPGAGLAAETSSIVGCGARKNIIES